MSDLNAIKSKLADLEDRLRRNNVKFRGVAETVLPNDLRRYLQKMTMTLLPDTPEHEVVIDRAHRLPKPAHLSEHVPRDVIARFHFFQVKDNLMQFARRNSPLPDPYTHIQLYTDLSQHTILARKKLHTIAKLLRNHQITYKWGFPAILSVEEGLKLAKRWGLLPESDNSPSPGRSPQRMDPEWQSTPD